MLLGMAVPKRRVIGSVDGAAASSPNRFLRIRSVKKSFEQMSRFKDQKA